MKIIAYISVRHYLFSQMIPEMSSDDFEIFPMKLQEILLKLDINNLRNEFSAFWDYMLGNGKYDFLWSYHRPDEITLAKCRKHGIPVIIQEFFGWKPFRLSAVFPFDCDFEKAYREKNVNVAAGVSCPKEYPVITVPLEKIPLSKDNNIENSVRRYLSNPSSQQVSISFWNVDSLLSSRIDFLRTIIELVKSNDELKNCRIMVRPDPAYMEFFKEETEYVNRLADDNIRLDFSSVEESLKETDIVICGNTNYGVDGLRAGCEVINYGNKTFFSNPQLVKIPESISSLEKAIIETVEKVQTSGKMMKPFMPHLINDMQGPLSCTCEQPYDPVQMKKALQYAHAMPVLII